MGFLNASKNQRSSTGLLERLKSHSPFNPSMSFTASPMATNMSLFSWDNRCLASSEHWSSPSAGHRAVPEAELHGRVLAAVKKQTQGPLTTAHNSDDCSGNVTV